jgi:phosphopantothenoylcysteine decarboxylase/phosphopantothenate--cysteine ligase
MAKSFRVLVGVCGGVAAYKSAELVRRLRERGHEVRCCMTPSARSFLAPLTLEVLSGHAVYLEEYLTPSGSGEEEHISVAEWADVICVAPVTANTFSSIALGLGPNFLTTTILAHSGELVLAPAMHSHMWHKIVARGYVRDLETAGAVVVGPAVGALASGEAGIGRMVEPEQIVQAIENLGTTGSLQGRTVLVTAGPTREPLDPVRYLSNRSSGKMGFLLAAEAVREGADTTLISGPVSLRTPDGVKRIDVTTAREMHEAVERRAPEADLVIMTAAVADFRPRVAASRKIKKRTAGESGLHLDLEQNPDILRGLRDSAPAAVRVGFAAETEDLESSALEKMAEKDLDFLVANDVSRGDIGFDSDDNEVTVYRRRGKPIFFPRRSKGLLSAKLIELFSSALDDREKKPTAAS